MYLRNFMHKRELIKIKSIFVERRKDKTFRLQGDDFVFFELLWLIKVVSITLLLRSEDG